MSIDRTNSCKYKPTRVAGYIVIAAILSAIVVIPLAQGGAQVVMLFTFLNWFGSKLLTFYGSHVKRGVLHEEN